MTNPREHIAHDLPLAERLVNDLIADYLDQAAAKARITAEHYAEPYVGVYERAIDSMRHLHLDGWDHRLTPKILDALRRAGLLVDRVDPIEAP